MMPLALSEQLPAPPVPNLIYIYAAWPPGKQLLRLATAYWLQELCLSPAHISSVLFMWSTHLQAEDMKPSFA